MALFLEQAQAAFDHAVSADGLPLLIITMAGANLAVLLSLWVFKISPALHDLSKKISVLKQLSGPSGFVEIFIDFHTSMMKVEFLRFGWSEFVKSFPEQGSGHPSRIEISLKPSGFLNINTARRGGFRLPYIDQLSRGFIMVGSSLFFFTVFGASGWTSGIAMADLGPAARLVTVGEMLRAMSPPVWAASAFLATGLILATVKRGWVAAVAGRLDDLALEIERVTVTVTIETLLSRLNADSREQSACVRTFAENFPGTMARTLEDALSGPAPAVMATAVECALRKVLPEIMAGAMSEGMATIAGSLGDMSDTVEKAVGRDLRLVAGTLSALPVQISGAADDLRGATHAGAQEMARITETVNRTLEDTRTALESQLLAATAGLADAGQTARASLEHAGRTLGDSAQEAGSAFASAMAVAIGRLEATQDHHARGVEAVLNRLTAVSTEISRTLSTESAASSQTMARAIGQMAKAVTGATHEMKEQITALTLAVGAVEARIGVHVTALEGVTRLTQESESALAKSARSLSEATLPLTRTGEVLTQAMTTVVRNVETAVRGLTESQRLAGQLATDLKQAAQELKLQRSAGGPPNRPPAPWGGGARKP